MQRGQEGLLVCLLLLELFNLCLSSQVASITDRSFIDKIIYEHNDIRSNVTPPASNMMLMNGVMSVQRRACNGLYTIRPTVDTLVEVNKVPTGKMLSPSVPVTWDHALAKSARAWARRCTFDHNPYLQVDFKLHPKFRTVGENLAIGSMEATAMWASEVSDYDYNEDKCSKQCGHYTQVVWDNSYKIGCAAELCPVIQGLGWKNTIVFLCNYGLPGNFPRRPYLEGEPCSNCQEGDECEDGLCSNPERDTELKYSDWYPTWEYNVICSQDCYIALGVHLACILLIFIIDFCVVFFK